MIVGQRLPRCYFHAASLGCRRCREQWHAFVRGVAHDPGDLANVIAELTTFLMPHAAGAEKLGK
jgi:hypothetical protein